MQNSQGFSPEIQAFIIATEGGYVNHPKDPGKATNMGITIGTLKAWRGQPVSNEDVKALSRAEALEIYKAQYWDTMQCSRLPLGLDYLVFDYGVNSGPARAVKDLQRTVGSEADGILGQKTLAAIYDFSQQHSLETLFMAYAERRWKYVQGLSTFPIFGEGWKKRIWGNQKGMQRGDIGAVDRALKLYQGRIDELSDIPTPAPGKAEPEKPDALDFMKDPAMITGLSGAVATVLGAIKDQPILQFAAVLAVVGLMTFYVIQRRKADPS